MRIGDACWGAGRHRSTYRHCRFDGIHFHSRAPGNARFVSCAFEEVVIHEFLAHDVELIGCTFSGRLDGGFLNGSRIREDLRLFDRKRNRIVGNDFGRCELRDFAFRSGIDLDLQVLPQGPRYLHLRDPRQAIRAVQRDLPRWEEAEERRLGQVVLDAWGFEAGRGQKQIFICLPTNGVPATVYRRLLPIVAGATAR